MRALLTWAFAVVAAGAAFAAPAVARERLDPMEMLAKSDANRDGRVSRAEFVDARRAHFKRMDRNDDGYFSVDDLPRMVRKRAGEKVIINIKTWMDGHRPPDRVLPQML